MVHAPKLGALHFIALVLAICSTLATIGRAQLLVQYGDPVRSGTIAQTGVTHTYLLVNCTAGDIVRFSFCSESCCSGPYYYHQLDVRQGTTSLGTIIGVGSTAITLPSTGAYSIDVRARNLQSVGWYTFQVDRVIDPVAVKPTAFGWLNAGSIAQPAEFVTYRFSATAGSSAQLAFVSQSCCSGPYYYHQAEILDPTGTPIAAPVVGIGSPTYALPVTGYYTLLIYARNYQSAGFFTAQLNCQSWPGQPCGGPAWVRNYGTGWPGTLGVPALTASAPPVIGTTISIDVGNSSGQATPCLLLLGTQAASSPLAGYGGNILVGYPTVLSIAALPPAGTGLPVAVPAAPWLSGWGFTMQSLVFDAGAASGGVAFSRGLALIL